MKTPKGYFAVDIYELRWKTGEVGWGILGTSNMAISEPAVGQDYLLTVKIVFDEKDNAIGFCCVKGTKSITTNSLQQSDLEEALRNLHQQEFTK